MLVTPNEQDIDKLREHWQKALGFANMQSLT